MGMHHPNSLVGPEHLIKDTKSFMSSELTATQHQEYCDEGLAFVVQKFKTLIYLKISFKTIKMVKCALSRLKVFVIFVMDQLLIPVRCTFFIYTPLAWNYSLKTHGFLSFWPATGYIPVRR